MLNITADAGRIFIQRVILPLGAIVGALLVLVLAGLFWIADYQTQINVAHQARLARHALENQADRLIPSVTDYAHWDDAVEHIVDKPDRTWMLAQFGRGPEVTLGLDFSFVVDDKGQTIYSYVAGSHLNGAKTINLPHAFAIAYKQWQKHPDKVYSVVLPYQSQAVTVAVAPIQSVTDTKRKPNGYAIVFVARVDDAALDKLRRTFDLDNLRITSVVEQATHALSSIRINGDPSDGLRVYMIWDPWRPGDQLLRVTMPFFGLLALALAILGFVLTRFVKNSTQLLTDREQKAGSDSLTGLANRHRFTSELEQAMARVTRGFSGVTVMYIDLDGFKQVNDSLGHAAGDELLKEVGRRLTDCLRANDIVARLGGDEFVVLMTGWVERNYVQAIAGRILISVARPFTLKSGVEASVGCSIGIADCWEPDVEAATLLNRADEALYQAKAAGKNTMRFFDINPAAKVERPAHAHVA